MKKGREFSLELLRVCAFALVIGLLALSIASFLASGASAFSRSATRTLGGCPVFPANNVWNTDISHLSVSANSANYLASIGLNGHLHPDFGSGLYDGAPIGIPYVVVPANQSPVPVSFAYSDESDPGPYPVPRDAPVEGGSNSDGDRHVLVVARGSCKLYEMYASYPQKNGGWKADSGAVWNLNSNTLRPATWTSADAAGLPILPGLISYDDIASGAINHALRFTVARTQNSFIWPARHAASSSSNTQLPPMGLRLRLKASVPISGFSRTNQIILTALKRYGMFVADNGSSWYLSGTSDDRWNNDDLHALSSIPGSDFEAVNESSLELSANSGQVKALSTPTPTPIATATATPMSRVVGDQEAVVRKPDSVPATDAKSSDNGAGVFLWVLASGLVSAALVFWQGRMRRNRRFRSPRGPGGPRRS